MSRTKTLLVQTLEKTLRNKLEHTVTAARDVAEAAARAAVQQLGVGEPKPYTYLSDQEKELRRSLRIHGRQLGDTRNARTEVQEIDRLTEEVAYEHWHRMLFARFLAENDLLMYPDPDDLVAVTLEECEDLAADEDAANGWELASRFASRMLPQIFRPDSPVFQLVLPPEHQQRLERLVSELPTETFTASDSLGWVYQFWQAKKKDEVNASEVKIGARELPAVTQLFTEPYMVAFLLDNSLGAWWIARVAGLKDGRELRPGAREILRTARTEEELREFFALPGVPLEYLRFIKQDDGEWTPAAGIFDGWPESLSEVKTLDPCCGSGHFLVAAFLMLVAMRMALEGLSARDAADRVLSENIHGLELDQRCVELAGFALALTAWRYPDAGGYRKLPELNVACSGLAISAKKEEWLDLAGDNTNLRMALEELHKHFKDAGVLGSLINPEIGLAKGSLFDLEWEEVGPLLTKALSGEKDDERTEMGVVAQGAAKASELLSSKYILVVTNVPYLSRRKQNDILRRFCAKYSPGVSNDLATTFLQRCKDFSKECGLYCIVLPQNFLFLQTYHDFREQILLENRISLVAKLGPAAFQEMNWWAANTMLLSVQNLKPDRPHHYAGIDASGTRITSEKPQLVASNQVVRVQQLTQFSNPDCRITFEKGTTGELLSEYAESLQGISPADLHRFVAQFWELPGLPVEWTYLSSSFPETENYCGRYSVLRLDELGKVLGEIGAAIRGRKSWGRKGVLIRQMRHLPATLSCGQPFDANVALILPKKADYLPAIWSFCSSPDYHELVRKIDQKTQVTNATLAKVPFDFGYWSKLAQAKYPNGLPKPYSNDPTQWIFHGHPAQSDEPLQVAVARLLGQRWPAELDNKMDLSYEACVWVNKSKALLPLADEDGIVCIPPVRGESSAADRLLNLLAAAYGDQWGTDTLSNLLTQADHASKSVETWLRDKFFLQHCRLFQHRPFIWQLWDGLRDGFAALVNYHKLDRKNLETLIYTYLGDWVTRQKDDIKSGVDGAAEKLAAAENLKKRLELILEGEAPHDIFVRWKPIEKQPIGWEPDLNDGVRLNIRPFMRAGVLRFNKKPQINISWDKDRGKDVESAPWYRLFDGDRINDHHLSLTEKKAAREASE